MVHEYVQFKKDESRFQTLNPKIEKIILKNILIVVGAVLVIFIILLVVNSIVGLDVFLIPFEELGITINPSKIFLNLILTIIIITIFLLGGNYLITRNTRYEFYQDKLIMYKSKIFSFKPKEIPYQNIVKVLGNTDSIFNKLFNSGTIVLELSGKEEDKVELEFIDNVGDNVRYIQNLIQEWKSIRQAEMAESYKIGRVVERY